MIGSLSRSFGSSSTGIVTPSGWVRPSDWLTLPTLANSDQRVVGLFAVYNSDSNYIALSAAGNYTVAWGDGIIENFNSGVTAQHNYDYSSVSNSTLSVRGYKQAIISITPQSGNNLTSVNFQRKPSIYASSSIPVINLLDVNINSGSLTTLTISNSNPSVYLGLEQVTIGNNALTDLSYLFSNLVYLEFFTITTSTLVTNITGMLTNCYSLKYPSLFDTSNVTNGGLFSRAINGTHGITVMPSYNLSKCTNFTAFLANTSNLVRFMPTGITRSISFLNCNLSATAINEIFTNLGTASGSQTITVTGNRGAATCNPSIATAKGWTVVV